MKLNVKGLGLSLGLLWGGCMLFVGLVSTANGIQPGGNYYGKDFLLAMASIYPGYRGVPEVQDSIYGALYGLADGLIAGVLIAWLYNLFAGKPASSSA